MKEYTVFLMTGASFCPGPTPEDAVHDARPYFQKMMNGDYREVDPPQFLAIELGDNPETIEFNGQTYVLEPRGMT